MRQGLFWKTTMTNVINHETMKWVSRVRLRPGGPVAAKATSVLISRKYTCKVDLYVYSLILNLHLSNLWACAWPNTLRMGIWTPSASLPFTLQPPAQCISPALWYMPLFLHDCLFIAPASCLPLPCSSVHTQTLNLSLSVWIANLCV